MKLQADCVPCLFKHALRTAKISTQDETKHWEVLSGLARLFSELPEDTIQVEVAGEIQKILADSIGDRDPYRHLKRHYNDLAIELSPQLRKAIETSEDPLLTAIRVAVAGNIIDFGVSDTFNVEQTIRDSLTREFAVFNYNKFCQHLAEAETILYIADNTGEIVFDRLLVEQLLQHNKQVTIAVRGGPAINDATLEDAIYVGFDKIVPIITTGTALPGTVLAKASLEFKTCFESADLVISKGQGNFEGLSHCSRSIVFLLKAKCQPIASELGVQPGDMVFYLS
ncbi:MAG: DUF89 family protein [Cyanobacteria bacterium SID2]|nr:DUF89 family protein [Cyanobacteria bacterium SID2]MBP0004168.1 DUF89 family protein [Cyanobacteria bacterium SBC]